MASAFRIRAGGTADTAAVAAIERAVFSEPWSAASLAALLAQASVVCEVDGSVVGYALFRVTSDEGELINLAVAPSMQRRGVGRELLEAGAAQMQAQGARVVFLEVRESNAGARAFYRGLGFAEVGYRPRYYRNPTEDAVVMRRVLGQPGGSAKNG